MIANIFLKYDLPLIGLKFLFFEIVHRTVVTIVILIFITLPIKFNG
jgi:hypothetical protein